jgi:hypothetical protein
VFVQSPGAGGGAGGEEHTRQPPEVTELSEDHVIDPVPKTKLEGPKDSPYPPKELGRPAVLGMTSLSQHASVEKKVAVMRLPMASDVGVMVHAWLMPYANGKLGERMQFVAAGSVVQRPEVMVKNCCALVKPTIMSRKAPHVPPMQGRPEGYSISTRMRVQYCTPQENKFGVSGDLQPPSAPQLGGTSTSQVKSSRSRPLSHFVRKDKFDISLGEGSLG